MTDEGKYAHLMMLALLGKTATHLRERHGILPSPDDKRANATAHMEAHSIPPDARWSWRTRQFRSATNGRTTKAAPRP